MNRLKAITWLLISLLSYGITTSAHASLVSFTADMDGLQANAGAGTGSPGTGNALMTLDEYTNEFSWNIQWSGLTGEVTVAHFHGPATADVNAGVEVPITISLNENFAIGNQNLSGSQANDLLSGLWYINIHTTAHAAGEIRGQVNVVPIPAATWLFSSGLLGLISLIKRKTA